MSQDKQVGVGVGVLILKDNKVLLGKRHEDYIKADSELEGEGTWTMPGGKLEFGESFDRAAKRETKEETGIELKEVKVICINNDQTETAQFVTIGLLAEAWSGQPQAREPEKITRWNWFDQEDLPSPLYPLSAKILQKYQQGIFF